MKQILILRHAKSSWEDETLADFDRPLSERGLKDAPRIGKYLRKIKRKPDVIVSSSAQRTRQTAKLVTEFMKQDESIITWNKDLYYGSAMDYLKVIQATSSKVDRLMLVGHNPKVEQTAGALIGNVETPNLRMPTAALICLNTYAINWEQIHWGTCQLAWMINPKALNNVID